MQPHLVSPPSSIWDGPGNWSSQELTLALLRTFRAWEQWLDALDLLSPGTFANLLLAKCTSQRNSSPRVQTLNSWIEKRIQPKEPQKDWISEIPFHLWDRTPEEFHRQFATCVLETLQVWEASLSLVQKQVFRQRARSEAALQLLPEHLEISRLQQEWSDLRNCSRIVLSHPLIHLPWIKTPVKPLRDLPREIQIEIQLHSATVPSPFWREIFSELTTGGVEANLNRLFPQNSQWSAQTKTELSPDHQRIHWTLHRKNL